MIEISVVRLPPEAEGLVLDVLRSGRLAQGPMVERFERAMAAVIGAEHAVAVSSGTSALEAALEALGVGPGDEVVTSALTFAATLNAILAVGATPRIADIDPDELTIDPDAVEAAMGPRTAAILPVHLYGLPADLGRITGIAARHGVAVVEDAAQALGAEVAGAPVGSRGVGCFSFYATKALTTGEGGLVTTEDAEVADRLRLLRNQGMRARYEYERIGHNLRMTELQAALGLSQAPTTAERMARRRANAARLSDGLTDVAGVRLPPAPPGRTHAFSHYTVRVTPDAAIDRDTLRAQLAQRGIETAVHYPRAVYDYRCYRDDPRVKPDRAVEAERAASEVVSLPVHPWLDPGDVDRIVGGIREALAG
jgi:dTDP-4-amino-4,6-dideoxygalactose transaminase